MNSPQNVNELTVIKLPREPFLVHSRQLFDGLLGLCGVLSSSASVLEIGCGPASVLSDWIDERFPHASLIQIDALPNVVDQAKQFRPGGDVRQLRLDKLSTIDTASQDLVVGMSVFDQNTVEGLPPIGRELARVLKPDGAVVYIHNEELNLPAVAKSFLDQRNQFLLPSPIWQPAGDVEYAIVDVAELDACRKLASSRPTALVRYLKDLYPYRCGRPDALSSSGNQVSPKLGAWTPDFLRAVRQELAILSSEHELTVLDVSTTQLLLDGVLEQVFSQEYGFETQLSEHFELRVTRPWQDYFTSHPGPSCFVRGVARFGYALNTLPAPADFCDQRWSDGAMEIAGEEVARDSDQLTLVAYQHGLVARRT